MHLAAKLRPTPSSWEGPSIENVKPPHRMDTINNSRCFYKISVTPLQARKYDEARNLWQGQITRDYRFYFRIAGDTYVLLDIMKHPK